MFKLKKSSFTILSLVLAIILIISASWLVSRRVAKAQTLSVTNFGGPVLTSTVCCNGIAILVGPPKPGYFLFTLGSIPYAWYNQFTPGANVLGTYTPGATCQLLPFCAGTLPLTGRINIIGSSGLGL